MTTSSPYRSTRTAAILLALGAIHPSMAATFSVTSNADSGAGSLREAITLANANPDVDVITFAIGSGSATIQPATMLPTVSQPLRIQGLSQPPGGSGPRIVLDGSLLSGSTPGLNLVASGCFGGNCYVEGLDIINFPGDGIRVQSGVWSLRSNWIGLTAAGAAANGGGIRVFTEQCIIGGDSAGEGNVISGNVNHGVTLDGNNNLLMRNWIGLSVDGTTAIPNGWDGVRVFGDGNWVGSFSSADGNVISGNAFSGVAIDTGASNTLVLNNRIGTSANGMSSIGNDRFGVDADGGPSYIGLSDAGNLISGNGYGGIGLQFGADGVAIAGNWIGLNAAGTGTLGNASAGIRLYSSSNTLIGGPNAGDGNVISGNYTGVSVDAGTSATTILGNRIGTNPTGTTALGNSGSGISVNGSGVVIGGDQPGDGNLISGNGSDGVSISGEDAGDTTIRGNRIGTTADGLFALPNGGYGIRALQGNNALIGGDTPADGNLVSGNGRGIAIEKWMSSVVLKNNIVGLNANETAKLPNGSSSGIDVSAPDTMVGAPGAGNVVAGSESAGIVLSGETAMGTTIQGNWIGTNRNGDAGLGNRIGGIFIARGLLAQIGGLGAGEGNVIANNDYAGIFLDTGHSISFLGNSMYGNDPIGIELAGLGPEANDAQDPDTGPNHFQNFPVITSALASGGMVGVDGNLDSLPSSDFIVEIFHSPACHASGLGEGKTPIGHFMVSTDASGHGVFSQSLPLVTNNGVVTALATAPDGSTSAFSPCHALSGPNAGTLQVWRSPLLSWEGAPPLAVTVVRSMGNAGAVSVTLSTSDDTATAPDDYLGTTQQIDFADGEVMKTVLVPIIADNVTEAQEQFHVSLSNPTGGASLGAQANVDAIIIDVGADFPMYYLDAPSIDEPATGQANLVFSVTLTPSDIERIIEYHTEDGSAIAGLDYEAVSGQLVFPASNMVQTQTVSVPVLADQLAEDAETFYLNTHSEGQIAVFASPGIGTIHASSAPPMIFKDGLED